MFLVRIPRYLQRMRHKPVWMFLMLLTFVAVFLDKTSADVETEPPQTTTPEPGKFACFI